MVEAGGNKKCDEGRMSLYIPKSCQAKIKAEYQQLRESLIKQMGGRCWQCGGTKALSCHHLLPVRYGGDNRLENLILACLDKNAPNSGCHWDWNGRSYRWIRKNKDRLIRWPKSKIIRKMRKSLVDGSLPYRIET